MKANPLTTGRFRSRAELIVTIISMSDRGIEQQDIARFCSTCQSVVSGIVTKEREKRRAWEGAGI